MSKRPLKFNEEMLAKVLSGEKTQTRRPVKGYDVFDLVEDGFAAGHWRVHGRSLIDVPELDDDDNVISVIQAGTYEKMLVRGKYIDRYCPYTIGGNYIHACDVDGNPVCEIYVTVRVERLQDITHDDAYAEGIHTEVWDQTVVARNYQEPDAFFQFWSEKMSHFVEMDELYRQSFSSLWSSIFGEESWQSNPWVWVIEFKRVEGDA